MSFLDLLKNAGLMLCWWIGGGIVFLLGMYLLIFVTANSAAKGQMNWFSIVSGLIIAGVGGLAVMYGTRKHDR